MSETVCVVRITTDQKTTGYSVHVKTCSDEEQALLELERGRLKVWVL